MRFIYTGTNNSGKILKGKISAINRSAAQDKLTEQEINIINVDIDEEKIGILNYFNLPTISDLIIFSKQMHALLRAGIPIIRSINIVGNSTKNSTLATTLLNVANRLEAGYGFGVSLEKYPKVFFKLIRTLVTVGEQTGTLSNTFQQVSSYLEKDNEIRKRVKTAMRYPILVLTTIIIALVIINIVVIPSFTKFFKEFKAELPMPTKVLIASSKFSVKYWWLILLITAGLIILFLNFINTKKGRLIWDHYKIKFPIFGEILEKSLLAKFSRSFALCFKTGVPLLESLVLISTTCDNTYMEKKIIEMKTGIERGESMTIAAKNTKLFNGLILQMILIGEESGELDRLLEEVALFYEEELEYQTKQLSSLIEPLLIGIMAVMVLILALGIFLPMWGLAQVTSSG